MSWLSLFLTQKCNRKCSYCDIGQIPLSQRRTLQEDLIETYIPLISQQQIFQNIGLTGGEVGYLDYDILNYILNQLKNKHVVINTNGLFIQRYFDKFYDLIDMFVYHPTDEISDNVDRMIDDPKVIHLFPIHKQNLHILPDFLESSKDYNISFSPYDSKFEFENDPYCLTKDDLKYIYDTITCYENIHNKEYFKDLININYDTLQMYREACFKHIEIYPSVDFVNGLIKKCVCSHTRSAAVDLTKSNFIRLLNNAIDFSPMNMCDTCLHVLQYKHDIMSRIIHRRNSICGMIR